MESEASATELLAQVDRARERAAALPARRAIARLDVWESVGLAAFLAVFLLAARGPSGEQGPPMGLLLIPAVMYGALAKGALARLGVRRRYGNAREWAMLALRMGVFVVAVAVVLNPEAPLAVQFALPLAGFALLALPSVIVLVRLRAGGGEGRSLRGAGQPLRPAVRVTTILIGALGAVGVIAAPSPMASLTVMLLAFIPIFLAAVAEGSSWGFSSVGAAWGARQWAAFAIITAGQFAVALLVAYISPPTVTMIVIGAALVAVMVAAAFAPGAREPIETR